ncbi:hypothetical protein BVY03_01645 [bacterium K02(2017)]|nr:hypothetical protein BVY03_01645 [bacterium K02(2017)]
MIKPVSQSILPTVTSVPAALALHPTQVANSIHNDNIALATTPSSTTNLDINITDNNLNSHLLTRKQPNLSPVKASTNISSKLIAPIAAAGVGLVPSQAAAAINALTPDQLINGVSQVGLDNLINAVKSSNLVQLESIIQSFMAGINSSLPDVNKFFTEYLPWVNTGDFQTIGTLILQALGLVLGSSATWWLSSKLYGKIKKSLDKSEITNGKKSFWNSWNKLLRGGLTIFGALSSYVLVGGSLSDIWANASYPVFGVAALGGAAFAYSAKESVEDLFSWFRLNISNRFNKGQYVSLDHALYDFEGYVISRGPFVTTLVRFVEPKKDQEPISDTENSNDDSNNLNTMRALYRRKKNPEFVSKALKDLSLEEEAKDKEVVIYEVPNRLILKQPHKRFPEREVDPEELEEFHKMVDTALPEQAPDKIDPAA